MVGTHLSSVGDGLQYPSHHGGGSPVLATRGDAEFQFGGGGNEEAVFSPPSLQTP